jgi:hypothetical protein
MEYVALAEVTGNRAYIRACVYCRAVGGQEIVGKMDEDSGEV